MQNYDAQQHRAGQIISLLILQTITTAQMLCWRGRAIKTWTWRWLKLEAQ